MPTGLLEAQTKKRRRENKARNSCLPFPFIGATQSRVSGWQTGPHRPSNLCLDVVVMLWVIQPFCHLLAIIFTSRHIRSRLSMICVSMVCISRILVIVGCRSKHTSFIRASCFCIVCLPFTNSVSIATLAVSNAAILAPLWSSGCCRLTQSSLCLPRTLEVFKADERLWTTADGTRSLSSSECSSTVTLLLLLKRSECCLQLGSRHRLRRRTPPRN